MDNGSCDDTNGSRVTFLLGAGRSGTTLLYKMLSLHPDIAYISNYENRFSWLPIGWLLRLTAKRMNLKLGAWFNRGNAYFVRRPFAKAIIPTPVEGESVYASCGLPLLSPGDYVSDISTRKCIYRRFARIRKSFDATVFLSKRTANNRRLDLLNSIFPAARYIHLIRDGRDVANSLARVEWWDNHTLFWDGRRPRDLELAGEERLVVCAKNWVREMAELEKNLALIERSHIYELRYEELLADPVSHLARILAFLGLPMTAEFREAIESLQLHYRPSDWVITWTASQLKDVFCEEQSTLRRLGYIE